MIVIVMGVTGTGKSTVAQALVRLTGWEFAEGDEFHSAANVEKMRAGIPLTDSDRAPWLSALHDVLAKWIAEGKSGVMTCSALKEAYRQTLVAGLPEGEVRFALLEAPRELLQQRLQRRPGHYMNPALLDSQLATLEMPENALRISSVDTPADSAVEIARQLGLAVRS